MLLSGVRAHEECYWKSHELAWLYCADHNFAFVFLSNGHWILSSTLLSLCALCVSFCKNLWSVEAWCTSQSIKLRSHQIWPYENPCQQVWVLIYKFIVSNWGGCSCVFYVLCDNKGDNEGHFSPCPQPLIWWAIR